MISNTICLKIVILASGFTRVLDDLAIDNNARHHKETLLCCVQMLPVPERYSL